MNVFDILKERGFIDKATHDNELKTYFNSGTVTCYVGFDPTALSLHVGNLVPIMALTHMKRNGHKPIAVIGGGTGLIGDPSGKTEMRKVMQPEEISKNIIEIKNQLSNFTKFEGKHALLLNNQDWLAELEYIPFIRDIGRHFSVNRMIKAESYKSRLSSEGGLNFIEFNYMILQAYDFNMLYEKYKCRLQMGGSDQWGNIVAGIDLVRRKNRETVFGITFPLITNSSGSKMGKTVDGAIWLNPSMTSIYNYYQFWMNTADVDLERFMSLFTFLPMKEIKEISSFNDKEINFAKNILAFEATSLAHGIREGIRAHQSVSTMFGNKKIPKHIFPSSQIPRLLIESDDSLVPSISMKIKLFYNGIPAVKLFKDSGLTVSISSARRLIEQGGGYINGIRISNFDYNVCIKDIIDKQIILRAGKKRFLKIKIL